MKGIKFQQTIEDTKQPIELQFYPKYTFSLYNQLIETISMKDKYEWIERRIGVYMKIMQHYQIPFEDQDQLLTIKTNNEVLSSITTLLPLKTPSDVQNDLFSYFHTSLIFYERKQAFDTIESIIFLHRLIITTPANHFRLLNCQTINRTSNIPTIEIPFLQIPQLLPLRIFPLIKGKLQIPSNQLFFACFVYQINHKQRKFSFQDVEFLDNHVLKSTKQLYKQLLHDIPVHQVRGIFKCSREMNRVLNSMPPCIYHLHQESLNRKTLKYDGRKEMNIFFKHAGISLW